LKIAVVSDTHGKIMDVINILKSIEGIELIIHLGDFIKDAIAIQNALNVEMVYAKGNCDIHENNEPHEKLIEIMEKKILICHGHQHGVKVGLNNIYYRAKELNADMALFGHTHIPINTSYDEVLLFNPGSPSLPRGGSRKSIGIIEIDEKICAKLIEME